jgi:hypothetical protein
VALRPTLSDGLLLSSFSPSYMLLRGHLSKDVPVSLMLLKSACKDLIEKEIYRERSGYNMLD